MEGTRAPAGAALETVREVLAAHGVRGEDPALARAMPEDSMGEILGRVNDAESYAPVILELGLFGGRIAEREFFACRTVGDLVERYYGNSYSLLVSQFVEDDKMDLEELKQLIATIESKRK